MTHRSRIRTRGPASRGALAMLAGVLLVGGVLQVSVAAAQDTEETPVAPPELLLIDAGESPYGLVRVGDAPTEIEILIDGESADVGSPVAIRETGLPMQTTIVIDNSAAAADFLESYLSAAQAYVADAGEDELVSVWTTGGVSRLRVGANGDHVRTSEIIAGIVSASGASMLNDTIRDASVDLVGAGAGAGATNVIVLAGSIEGGSVATPEETRGAVQAVGASAFAVATDEVVVGSMRTLVSSTYGGAFAATEDLAEIAGYGSSVSQVVGGTWMIPFESDQLLDNNQLTFVVGDTSIRASYAAGSRSSGGALAPFANPGSSGIPGFGFLSGDTGRLIGLLFGALAAGLGAYAMVLLTQNEESTLTTALNVYDDNQGEGDSDAEGSSAFSKNALLKRAVEISEDLAERRGMLSRLEATLERADLPLRPGEALTAGAAITGAFLVVGLLLTGNIIGMLVFGVIGGLIPGFMVRVKAGRRRKKFMTQLPDTLILLSSTLKAGYSFMQGIEAVSKEIEDPMGSELRRIVTEAQLGRPLEDAMDASADRMDSADFSWAVMAVKIQREVGGNLSELLLTVAETMTERERLRRDIASLVAEGKMSAIVLGALPILLGLAMWAMNPEYIETLFTDSLGKVLLGLSFFAVVAGFAWMRKIINIDI